MPYADLDNEYAIMFRVGNGIPPTVSNDILKDEGKDFLLRCFHPEPHERWNTSKLLEHSFVKVCYKCPLDTYTVYTHSVTSLE